MRRAATVGRPAAFPGIATVLIRCVGTTGRTTGIRRRIAGGLVTAVLIIGYIAPTGTAFVFTGQTGSAIATIHVSGNGTILGTALVNDNSTALGLTTAIAVIILSAVFGTAPV